jgi:hypothetical protein
MMIVFVIHLDDAIVTSQILRSIITSTRFEPRSHMGGVGHMYIPQFDQNHLHRGSNRALSQLLLQAIQPSTT